MRSNLIRGQDYELVPDSLWKALLRWYGGSLPLARQVVNFLLRMRFVLIIFKWRMLFLPTLNVLFIIFKSGSGTKRR